MEKQKNTWGGKRANTGGRREGAGRKAIYSENDKPQMRGIRFTDAEWQKIKTLAEQSGQTIRQFILQCVFGK